jgi:secreted PhoX family phosphatase
MSTSVLSRRRFLAAVVAGAIGPAAWHPVSRALGALAVPQPGYGPLQPADANGVMLPVGFRSRIIARAGFPVGQHDYFWRPFPEGAGTFPTGDGGWVLAVNSENPPPVDVPGSALGAVSAVRFGATGAIVDAYQILSGTRANCAGGATPWGTWLSCEEFDLGPGNAGLVWECDPFGRRPAVPRPALGSFKHEAVAVDVADRRLYLSEDQPDGLLYRFTPSHWGDLSEGLLEAAQWDESTGLVTWHRVPDPSAATTPTRRQVPSATRFDGGEGCTWFAGTVYLTTKGDDRLWAYDTATMRLRVLYEAPATDPVLSGVDNVAVHPPTGDVYVAEDGGNMEVVIVGPDGGVSPFVRLPGPEHGVANPTPLPTTSEVTGLAFSPDGTRLYFNSQRAYGLGVTYEVRGPFRGTHLNP